MKRKIRKMSIYSMCQYRLCKIHNRDRCQKDEHAFVSSLFCQVIRSKNRSTRVAFVPIPYAVMGEENPYSNRGITKTVYRRGAAS